MLARGLVTATHANSSSRRRRAMSISWTAEFAITSSDVSYSGPTAFRGTQ